MESVDARPESTQPAAPPPIAAWWGHTGLLYVGASVLAGAVVGFATNLPTQSQQTGQETSSILEYVLHHIQADIFLGAATGVAQWVVLSRLVRRALLTSSGHCLSQPERRLVRNTALWIVATVTGLMVGSAVDSVISGLLIQAQAYGLLGLPSVALYGLITGFALGTAQWFVLRCCVPGSGIWIWSTTVGYLLGYGCLAFAIRSPLVWLMFPAGGPITNLRIVLLGVIGKAIATLILTAFQAHSLKRLALGWMKRLHDEAQKAFADGA